MSDANHDTSTASFQDGLSEDYGMTTSGEFMGESWLALKKVSKNKDQLPAELIEAIENSLSKIKQGFKIVGQYIE